MNVAMLPCTAGKKKNNNVGRTVEFTLLPCRIHHVRFGFAAQMMCVQSWPQTNEQGNLDLKIQSCVRTFI
jgi:hypothetical protein